MNADIVGALERLDKSWRAFEHKGKPMTQEQVRKVLVYGIQKGYKHTGQFSVAEIDAILEGKLVYKYAEHRSGTTIAEFLSWLAKKDVPVFGAKIRWSLLMAADEGWRTPKGPDLEYIGEISDQRFLGQRNTGKKTLTMYKQLLSEYLTTYKTETNGK